MRSRTLITTLTLALVALALAPGAASASSRQLALFQDDSLLIGSGDATREATLDEIRSLGADAIKAQLDWVAAAPGGRRKPAGFDGTDPSQYPGWGPYDELVADAEARGLEVAFALSPPAPSWATRGKRGRYERTDRPSAREFGRFAEAAAKRYPSVDVWSVWNEPNLYKYLLPQAKKNGVPAAPHLYRNMVRSAVAGFRRGGAGSDTILFGELLPIGSSRCCGPRLNLSPLRFLREMACLDSSYRPFRGRAARLRDCDDFKRLTGLGGFAYHPYTRGCGPLCEQENSSDDATIRVLGRVTRTLDRIRAKRRISGGRLPIWITEFDFQSDPPDRFLGVKLSRIPLFMGIAELWLAKPNRRVAAYSQYTMNDSPGSSSLWQGGLRFANGRAKKGVYEAYRLPLLVRRLGANAVEVRGAARPGGAGAVVQVQVRLGRSYENLGDPITVRNVRGYFSARFRLSAASGKRYRLVSGGHTSAAVKPITLFR
jgi:hypothetical protein